MPKAKIYDFIKSDPEEFQIPAQDNRGHSARADFRAPPDMVGQVKEIVSKRMFPYKTPAHLYRHALWRHLQWLKDKDSRLINRLSWMEAFMAIVQKSERRREHGTMMGYLDREIDALTRAGLRDEARALAFQAVNVIANGGDDDAWKREGLKQIRRKHFELLQGGVSLDPRDFEKE